MFAVQEDQRRLVKAGCTRQIVYLTRSPFIVTRCEQTPLSQKKTICYVSLATLLLQFKSEFKRASTFYARLVVTWPWAF